MEKNKRKLGPPFIDDSPRLAAYSIAEFCARFGVGRTFVYRELAAGCLRAKKMGRRTLISAADAERWFNSAKEFGTSGEVPDKAEETSATQTKPI